MSLFRSNGQVIIDVIPEVELIIEPQLEVPQLSPTESQNRFIRVFQQFIKVFTLKEHPLVIFLDDLQWADSATLKLMQLLITDPDSKYLLFIGAYRDNEVSPTHPLIQIIEEIEKTSTVVNNIVLQPLDLANVTRLIADTLNDIQRVKPLAELIWNKTGGNPFFLTQLLQALYQENLLTFDLISARWQWNIAEIQAVGITDKSVVELVACRIKKLPEATQEVLKLAACIGYRFTLDVLSIVNEQSPSVTASELYSALQAGLILPLSEAYRIPLVFNQEEAVNLTFDTKRVGYKFLHDRVQQAAYSLIPESEKQVTHLKIGQLLLKQTPPSALFENILDIVNQLNVGADLLANQSEKDDLAKLNLMAGKKAKASTAYEAAVKYLNVGLGLLVADSWLNQYDLTLNLYVETAETEYLNGNFDTSKTRANVALQKANTILEKVKVYEIQIQSYIAQIYLQEALNLGVQVLKILGVVLPNKPKILHLMVAVVQTKLTLFGKRIEDLAALPKMTDPDKLAAMQILMLIVPAASQSGSILFPLTILAMVRLAVKYGNSAVTAFAYNIYGAMLCDKFGDIEAGYRFGLLGLSLLSKMNAYSLKCRVYYVFNAFIRHFKEPVKEIIAPLIEGMHSGLETGDIEFVSYSAWTLNHNLLWSGENLELLEQKLVTYVQLIYNFKQELAILIISVIRQTVLNLQGRSSDKCALIGEAFNEAVIVSHGNNHALISVFYVVKTLLNYLFKNYKETIKIASLTEQYQKISPSFLMYSVSNFYYSLALLGEFNNASSSEQKLYMKQVAANQKKMKQWAYHAPSNYQHKYELVEAEKARVLGKYLLAMHLYDSAIALAKENGYIQEQALANELAAQFYQALGKINIAKTYMTEAYYGYIHWGAIAKVTDLDERCPELIIRNYIATTNAIDLTRTIATTTTKVMVTITTSSEILDLATVMKATHAISSEIVLNNLLVKLLNIILENAGAQKGCLILVKDNQLFIEAIDTSEHSSVVVLQSTPVEKCEDVPNSVINYVARTQQALVLGDATHEGIFQTDPYIKRHQPKSVLCAPIFYQGKFTGIFYLENNLATVAFTPERLELLKLLTSQAAIAIENARLYAREQEKSQQLQQSLQKLYSTQSQLVQTEKISSLGQLVAGVAHEVNNPVTFIAGNLSYANQYVEDLMNLLHLYEKYLPDPPAEIAAEIDAIDLEYLRSDLPKIISSMNLGTNRIQDIMQSLRNFSRTDGDEKKTVDIHEGLETTLMILQHRLKANSRRPGIQVIKEYGNLPKVGCYPGQLNQVFMNLLANAIDAIEESRVKSQESKVKRSQLRAGVPPPSPEGTPSPPVEQTGVQKSNISTLDSGLWTLDDPLPQIRIHTTADDNCVTIRIADNGPGMPEEVRQRLFDAFFTTKPEGKGTGLGLSISYQIVTEKHGGTLQCISSPGQGAEFVIQIPRSEQKH